MAACFYFIEERFMKMSDAFDLPLQTAVNELAIIDRKDCVVGWADAFSGEPARDCFVEAINSHDRMADEIAELRETLRQMVYLLDNGYDQNNSYQEDSVIDAKKLLNK